MHSQGHQNPAIGQLAAKRNEDVRDKIRRMSADMTPTERSNFEKIATIYDDDQLLYKRMLKDEAAKREAAAKTEAAKAEEAARKLEQEKAAWDKKAEEIRQERARKREEIRQRQLEKKKQEQELEER